MKKVDFDGFAHAYNDLLREQTTFFTADETYFARYKIDIVRRLATSEPRRVLEFGCGTGRNIPFLREAFPQSVVMGSDVSQKSLDLARSSNPGVHFWKEGDDDAAQSGFDLIFIAGVFHHVPPSERKAVAACVAERLNVGGTVVVFEHNPYNPVTRRIVSRCPYDEGVILLPPSELRNYLTGQRLVVHRRAYALFFPPGWKKLLPLERLLAHVPLGGQYWVAATRP